LGIIEALLTFQGIFEKPAGGALAAKIEWIHLSFLIEAH